MKKVVLTLIFLMVVVSAYARDWTPFDSFYRDYQNATDVQKESFVGTPVMAEGVVTNVQENYSKRLYGNVKYIVRLEISSSLYVNVGTNDDVATINKGDSVKAYGYFTDSSWILVTTVDLKDGHIRKLND